MHGIHCAIGARISESMTHLHQSKRRKIALALGSVVLSAPAEIGRNSPTSNGTVRTAQEFIAYAEARSGSTSALPPSMPSRSRIWRTS